MKSSDLLVRSGTSPELIRSILNLRSCMPSKEKHFSHSFYMDAGPAKMSVSLARNFYFHFQYEANSNGYAIIQLPVSSPVTRRQQVVLTDFFIADTDQKPYALGAVMLSYIASHCLTEAFARLKVDFSSCESEALLMVLLQSLVPSVSLTNEAAFVYEQQLTVLAKCVAIQPRQAE